MILTTYAHFVSFFRNFSHFFSYSFGVIFFSLHNFRVILGIFIGMLILDQTSARFTFGTQKKTRGEEKKRTLRKRQTMRHHFTKWISWALFLAAVQLHGIIFLMWFRPTSSSRADSRSIYVKRMRIRICIFQKIFQLQLNLFYSMGFADFFSIQTNSKCNKQLRTSIEPNLWIDATIVLSNKITI